MLLPLSHAQRERLAYLELKAYFVGELRRGDIEARFSIKPAAATRDLNAYRQHAPDNLVYDPYIKAYIPTPCFQPVFPFSAERVLAWFLHGIGDGQGPVVARSIPCEGAGQLVQPDFGMLSEITRAIHSGHALQISYLSLSSGAAKKVIVPVALADNGLRWHVRAYDRQKKRFADFVLTRIDKVKALDESAALHERIEADAQWNRRIELRLLPHPGLKHPEAVVADYRMQNGLVTLTVSAARGCVASAAASRPACPSRAHAPSASQSATYTSRVAGKSAARSYSIRIRINASRLDSRQEPYAVVPHVRICVGGGEQSPSLLRPDLPRQHLQKR